MVSKQCMSYFPAGIDARKRLQPPVLPVLQG